MGTLQDDLGRKIVPEIKHLRTCRCVKERHIPKTLNLNETCKALQLVGGRSAARQVLAPPSEHLRAHTSQVPAQLPQGTPILVFRLSLLLRAASPASVMIPLLIELQIMSFTNTDEGCSDTVNGWVCVLGERV